MASLALPADPFVEGELPDVVVLCGLAAGSGQICRLDDPSTSTYHYIMRTTVTLDDDVYEAAQAYARLTGQRLGRVLSEMARQALQPTRPSRKQRGRFPAFDVPPGSRVILAARVQRALDVDGIV